MRRLRARRGDDGLTLVELLVAMSLLAIAMTLVTALVVTVSRAYTREEAQRDSSTGAALGMQHLSRVIRAAVELDLSSGERAPAFSAASPTVLTLSAYVGVEHVDEGPVRVELALDTAADEIIERRFAAYRVAGIWEFRTTPSERRVLARDVVDAAVFAYERADGSTLPSRALTQEERREIAAVRVSYGVQTDRTGRVPPSRIVNVVSLPNLEITRTAP